MIALEQLPSLVLHQIISYLPYEALLALRDSCRFFLERVEDQVLEDLCLPLQSRNLSVITRVKSRPVLDLSVILRLRESEKCYVDSELETLRSQLNSLNLTKVGALTVKIEPEEDCRISWDYHARLENSSLVVYSTFCLFRIYDSLLKTALESDLKTCNVQSLEIQTDFLCAECRSFLTQLSNIPTFSRLKHLIINLHFNFSSTVGLYVHLIKLIFKIQSLESFEIRNIDPAIFDELRLWFRPEKKYFSRIRTFQVFTKANDSPDSFLLKFITKPDIVI